MRNAGQRCCTFLRMWHSKRSRRPALPGSAPPHRHPHAGVMPGGGGSALRAHLMTPGTDLVDRREARPITSPSQSTSPSSVEGDVDAVRGRHAHAANAIEVAAIQTRPLQHWSSDARFQPPPQPGAARRRASSRGRHASRRPRYSPLQMKSRLRVTARRGPVVGANLDLRPPVAQRGQRQRRPHNRGLPGFERRLNRPRDLGAGAAAAHVDEEALRRFSRRSSVEGRAHNPARVDAPSSASDEQPRAREITRNGERTGEIGPAAGRQDAERRPAF